MKGTINFYINLIALIIFLLGAYYLIQSVLTSDPFRFGVAIAHFAISGILYYLVKSGVIIIIKPPENV